MALPATDAFTGSGGATPLTSYSANWTMNNGAIQASRGSTDNFFSNAASDNGAHWNADTFGNDQYSQITLSGVLGTHWAGAAARAAASGATWYAFFTDGTGAGTEVYKIVGGTYTTLGSTGTQAWSVNDTLRLEVVGTT